MHFRVLSWYCMTIWMALYTITEHVLWMKEKLNVRTWMCLSVIIYGDTCKVFQELMLVLVLLKASCHFLEIHKMMVYYKERRRQDTSTQACQSDACDKSFSLPPQAHALPPNPGLIGHALQLPSSDVGRRRTHLACFLQIFTKVCPMNRVQANQDTAGCRDGNTPHLV